MNEIRLEDLKDILNIEKLQKDKPNIVIVATKCSGCGEIHPFIFSDEILYYATQYISWHQYKTCSCGGEVSVYSGHGAIVFNPHNIKFKDNA